MERYTLLADTPHWKTIVTFGVAGLALTVVMMTWVYPAYCDRYDRVKTEKTREYMESTFGISERSNPFIDADVSISVDPNAPLPEVSAVESPSGVSAEEAPPGVSPDTGPH